uniref:Uncharacterized protein n=1 Tax=Schizaphis graminum TaxID=13262 RepID=A0A2S2PW35_SCHGA
MNQSTEAENIYLTPEDIFAPPTDITSRDLFIHIVGLTVHMFAFRTGFELYKKLTFIYIIYHEVSETLRAYNNTFLLHPDIDQSYISDLRRDIKERALKTLLVYSLMVSIRLSHYYQDQISDLVTRFIIAAFDLDNRHHINGSDSDNSGDNDNGHVPRNNYRRPRYLNHEGYNEEYVLRETYNVRMSSGFYGEFLAINEYPEYGNYPANSDDENLNDVDTDEDNTDSRAYFFLDPVNTPTTITSVFGNNNNTI